MLEGSRSTKHGTIDATQDVVLAFAEHYQC
jgi:hypothetical protein